MIGRLTGTVTTTHKNPIIVDVHDVGYMIFVPPSLAGSLKNGSNTTLFIHTHIRDDAFDLYGFTAEQDLVMFELLLTVGGIGPRTAVAVMDRGATAIERAIMKADVDFFTTVPRLGKKNAQKIIIELKNKLGSPGDIDLQKDADGETKQFIAALVSMGFKRHEAIDALKHTPSTGTPSEKIRAALKYLG